MPYSFMNDYSEGAHEKILEALVKTNREQLAPYGTDLYSDRARASIKEKIGLEDCEIHFLTGGTQTNLITITAALKPFQGVLAAESGHIHVHETAAVEATGHKCLALPSSDGKITAEQVARLVHLHRIDESMEHTAQPKLVYISNPTEYGTIYSLKELEALSGVCRENGLYLFLDGARLGYGLRCRQNDVTLKDLARLCDAFYIGGTKVGALFGEALVLTHPALQEDFRYLIKQRGGMLAKGRLLGIQFETLFEDGLYWEISDHALAMADILRTALTEAGLPMQVDSPTNQLFPIVPDSLLERIREKYAVSYINRVDESHSCIRFCTSWATREADVKAFCEDLKRMI